MEFTFASKKMREVVNDKDMAYKTLGHNLANALLSLVADLREAMFMGELPERPDMSEVANGGQLSFCLENDVLLEIEVLVGQVSSNKSWLRAHRIKLLRVSKNGEILV